MQRRQTGNTGTPGMPRRSLMSPYAGQPSPYNPQQQPQPPQQQGYLQYPGLNMPMTSMESSIRSYGQQQQQQLPGRYWQAAPEPTAYGKQAGPSQGGGLDLELGDILDTTGGNTTGGNDATGDGSDMSMAGFDVSSFQDGMTGASAAKGGFHVGSSGGMLPSRSLTPMGQANGAAAPYLMGRKPAAASAVGGGAGGLVDAAFSRLADSRDEPDLSQRKLDEKNEKCEFHACPNRARVAQAYGKFCNRHVIVAPCGFPGCRDKAMLRASMCEKHLEQGKDALHQILASRAQNVPVCRTFGCFKNDQGRGYCRGHEKLLMATGRLPTHINKRRLNSAYTMCSYPDCSKHSQRNHLCRTHGNLIMKQAEDLASRPGAAESYEETLARLQKDIRRCTHESCTKNSQRDRLCTMHYYEKHNLQRDGTALAAGASSATTATAPSAVSGVCNTPDCTQPAAAKGQCKFHSGQSTSSTAEASAGDAIRAVERTRCGAPGCANMSYAAGLCLQHMKQNLTQPRYNEQFPTSGSEGTTGGLSASDVENEAKQALFILNGKPQTSGTSSSAEMVTSSASASSTCSNPMCARESFGRDYCEACQSLFAPLVVSVGDLPSGSAGYPFVGGATQPGDSNPPCRVANCGISSVRGGLCAPHFREFASGSLSVDQLALNSQQQQAREQKELADAAAAAAAAAEGKHASPTAGKMKKYFCRIDGCEKQAQKRGLCKRHFRMQEGIPAGRAQHATGAAGSGAASEFQTGAGSNPTAVNACRFPACAQSAGSGSLLCMTHSKATFCWQAGCENLVARPLFCEFHAFRQQCAFEGCMYTAERGTSGCTSHALARKCRHEYCDKFAVGSNSDWCRLHQLGCQDSPCALCRLHSATLEGLGEDENSNRSRSNANPSVATSKGLPGDSFGNKNSTGREPRLV